MSHAAGRLGLSPGKSGAPIQVTTNCFAVTRVPTGTFYHYNEFPDFKKPPNRERAIEIIERLQIQEPKTFNPRAVFDGGRNLFRSVALDFPSEAANFVLYTGNPTMAERPTAKGIKVRIVKVTVIEPSKILPVIRGQASHSPESLNTLTLLNVLIRMVPISLYPSNSRAFFTKETRDFLGNGLEIWRGLFQSVRPTLHRLLINVDVTAAVMYSGGILVDLVMNFLGVSDARDLSPGRLNRVTQRMLNGFLKGLMVSSVVPERPRRQLPRYRKILRIEMTGADDYVFTEDGTGENMTITEYFYKAHQYRMKLGRIICADVGNGIVYPLEVLKVKEGQFYKKTLSPTMTPRVLKFATMRPEERMQTIMRASRALEFANSDYLRHSGMTIDERFITTKGRVLPPPNIQWGGGQRPDAPRGGAWNVLGKRFYKPARVKAWAVLLYEPRVNAPQIQGFLKMFVTACMALDFPNSPPQILRGRPGADTDGHFEDLENAGTTAIRSFENEFQPHDAVRPSFILVVLPDSAIEIRTSVKRWGDCVRGCSTQCMKSGNLVKANNQYCNNLALKLNIRLGGINSVPSSSAESVQWLASRPTMIIGADVSHAAPDHDRPSVAGLVSSVDENFVQYVASSRVQQNRQEIIEDMYDMVENAVESFRSFWKMMHNRDVMPHRVIFYRDGVSEGQFKEVAEKEIYQIKDCFAKTWRKLPFKSPPPKLTFIVVGKSHHIRFFPKDKQNADKSGNCPAGLVVDDEIVNPVEYDFYLQSHGGLLGTSRPAHYTVIEDGNNIGADLLQSISYTLCHVYARATRSVSIPAPVYYADLVCSRGRFHSQLIHDGFETSGTAGSGERLTLEDHQNAYKGVEPGMKNSMYFA